MTAPAHWQARADAHAQAQKKLRAGLREKFPFAAEIGDRLRALGAKDARVVHAVNERGEEHGEAIDPATCLPAELVCRMLADDQQRKDLGKSRKNQKNSGPKVGA